MGKYPKDRRGTPQRRTPFANDGLPPDPHYGGYPLKWAKPFRRAKPGVLGCGFFRATGPWVCKNCDWYDSASAPGFAEPTCLVQHTGHLIRPLRGHLPLKGKALKSKPFAFPFRGRWHGEAVTDERNGAGYEGGPFEP